jgi:hypothetical protein
MGRLLWPLLIGQCVVLLSGCVRTQAKAVPTGPPLEMPAPPPRDVEPQDEGVPDPVPLPGEPAHRTPEHARPSQRIEPKIESKPEVPKIEVPIEVTPPVEEPPKPATTLQTKPANAEGEEERTIRETLTHASTDLSRIDYRVLNTDARNQYDTAKRFVEQAEDAMRAKKFVFAKNLADKAAALAAQLAGR